MFIKMDKLIGKKFKDKIINNIEQICDILLLNFDIAITPGIAFGKKNYIRLSYSVDSNKIELFVRKFNSFLSKLE